MPLTIRLADPHDPAVAHLIATHIAYGEAAYPSESNHHLTPDAHAQNGVALFAAWEGEDCLGMLGLRQFSDTSGEVKSMHVLEAGRGRGIGAALLGHVIQHAHEMSLKTLYLETGSREASAASRRLYARAGFALCAPFDSYVEDPESVFMTLDIQTSSLHPSS